MSDIAILTQAINSKQNISFEYDGLYRECSPHAIGYKGSEVNTHVYQYAGMTSKGPIASQGPGNWRCIHVSKMVNLKLIDGEWHTFNNHSVPSSCIDQFIAQVTY